MRIFLIGFMGSGKSHVGKRLAPKIGYSFLDLDHYIEEMAGKSIADFFETEGETAFRKLESTALKTLDKKENIIVSTGGGTPCFFDHMEWMNEYGTTVFLDVATSILIERLLPRTAHRPLLKDKSAKEIETYIEEKLAARRAYYEQSEIILFQTDRKQDRVATLLELLAISD